MKRVVLVADQRVQDEEYLYPYYRFQEAGFHLDVATPSKEQVYGKYGIPVKANKVFSDLNINDYDILVVPGGEAPERMRMNETLLQFVKGMYEKGKLIAAICHGPQVLISAKIVQGKRMTCYKGMKDDLINAGAIYSDESVIKDGNIITSPHYRNNPDFMKVILT